MNISKYLWAKKQPGELKDRWLSLNQHLEDTRNIGSFLWENWLSEGQKIKITNELAYFDLEVGNLTIPFLCYICVSSGLFH